MDVILAGVLCIVLIVVGCMVQRDANRYVSVEAAVVAEEHKVSGDRYGRTRGHMVLTVNYMMGGRQYTSIKVPHNTLGRHEPGDMVKVLVHPKKPEVAKAVRPFWGWILVGIGAMLLPVCLMQLASLALFGHVSG